MTHQTLCRAKKIELELERIAEDIRQVERIGGNESINPRLGVIFGERICHDLDELSPGALEMALKVILLDLKTRRDDKQKELEAL